MGTGGSRFGAGRPGWRRKCEQSFPLDIRALHRKGLLRLGYSFSWHWSRGDEPVGSIGLTPTDSGIQLSYSWTPHGGEPRRMLYDFAMVHTACNYGGTRPWFRCRWCGRRVAMLYGLSGDGYFGCRTCLRLGYISETEDRLGRLHRKMAKLEAQLDDGGMKPKGMRWRTFERLHGRIEAVDQALDTAFCDRAFRLFGIRANRVDDLL